MRVRFARLAINPLARHRWAAIAYVPQHGAPDARLTVLGWSRSAAEMRARRMALQVASYPSIGGES